MEDFDKRCMTLALEEAKIAFIEGEVPVGAVLAHNQKVIATAHNQVEKFKDATCHAEILCLKEGAKILGDWRLCDATLYVTLEPCPMCAGAATLSRVKRILWACPLVVRSHPIHQIEISSGLFEQEARELLQTFFQNRRISCSKSLMNS